MSIEVINSIAVTATVVSIISLLKPILKVLWEKANRLFHKNSDLKIDLTLKSGAHVSLNLANHHISEQEIEFMLTKINTAIQLHGNIKKKKSAKDIKRVVGAVNGE